MNRCILALESDKKDIYELQRAFQLAGITDRLMVMRNRDETLCYLKGVGVYSNRSLYPLPRLLLLDICAPNCGGMEILEWLHSTPAVGPILVIATGHGISDAAARNAYDLGVNAVFNKPGDIEELSRLIQSLNFVPETILNQHARV